MFLHDINIAIDREMCKIGNIVGEKFKLTLICRYDGDEYSDADILKSNDDFDKAVAAIRHLQNKDPVKDKP